MDKNKTTKLVGAGIPLAAAFVFLVIAVLNFPSLTEKMFGQLADTKEKLTLAQIVVSFFGFIGAILAFSLAIIQYLKSARWKRMEFIANEVKEFEADPVVQNALMMIDWGTRKINLNLVPNPTESDLIIIEREDQWKALLPHSLKDKEKYPEYQSEKFAVKNPKNTESNSTEKSRNPYRFSVEEAKIRDTYDIFLTRLDRFSTFIDAKLIDADELRPFINYWIDAITKNTEPEKDAEWRCALLTYIIFYEYSGVQSLLKRYGININPKENPYQEIKSSIKDEMLAERLFEESMKKWTDK